MEEPIRESSCEPGIYFVAPEPGTTRQSIGSQQWKVGHRYELRRVVGYGSFSAVCQAQDRDSGESVAVKRIGDVLQSPEQAKRVLRELCILRRLRHPHIISLRDAFLRPAATGPRRLVEGKVVALSVDAYLVQEFAEEGDLFSLRGQLSAEEVCELMWQLLQGVSYMHGMQVWHRDLKSQNIFVTRDSASGQRILRIGDFGSARSAKEGGSSGRGAAEGSGKRARNAAAGAADAREDSRKILDEAMGSATRAASLASSQRSSPPPRVHASDSFACLGAAARVEDLYTQVVALPLARQAGSSPYPPPSRFRAPLTRLVATPCYRAPEVVMSRGGYSSAIDMWSVGCIFAELLSRIAHVGSAATPALQVAPLFAMRGELPRTPERGECFAGPGGPQEWATRLELEALFAVIGTPAWADLQGVQSSEWRRYLARLPGRPPGLHRRFAAAGDAAVDLLARMLAFDPARRCSAEEALAHEFFVGLRGEEERAEGGMDEEKEERGRTELSVVDAMESESAIASSAPAISSTAPASSSTSSASSPPRVLHYWQEPRPGKALALLEEELARLAPCEESAPVSAASESCTLLRRLLEAEARAVQSASPSRAPRARSRARARGPGEGLHVDLGAFHNRAGPGPVPDYGRHRLNNVADTFQGNIDPEKYLGPQRHFGWTEKSGQGPRPGPAWGVAALPPGMLEDDALAAIISAQQLR